MAPNNPQSAGKYSNQRRSVPPPVITIRTARKISGKTLQDICDHINREFDFPKPIIRGTISGIENGHRGASVEMLDAIASALGITAGEIDTQYEWRHSRQSKAA